MITRIQELEALLEECENTLDAIRHGAIDAVVVTETPDDYRVYTLENADRPYRVLIEQIQEGAVTLGEDGTVLYCNCCLANMLEIPHSRVIGQPMQVFVMPEDEAVFTRMLVDAARAPVRRELTLRTAGGTYVSVYMSLSLLQSDGSPPLLCGVLTDLTDQKLRLRELAQANALLAAESDERARLEDTLRQAQKMEAVGQLTGGLAHDFNNLLTVVSGGLEMLKMRLAQGRLNEVDRYVSAAQDAVNRATSLTHRLLAFSRRQTLDPVATDANRLVSGMEELIRRTVGPAIMVETALASDLWPTLCDVSQLENAVLNLSINARDAMPEGGKLIVKTTNVMMDERAAQKHDVAPGQYVAIFVIDTGTGMAPEVIARAFDPFFTTKPIGRGTGLGLSMIYGFARQSNGLVSIDSEPGRGTTIRLYLPRHEAGEAQDDVREDAAIPARAEVNETVLVVDDEPLIRMLITGVLEELDYKVIEAHDGPSGLKIIQSDARIDLLITDIGLPGSMNGRQMADVARKQRPGLRVLFVTGYADQAAIGPGGLERGMQIIGKPFDMKALAAKIRAIPPEG